MRHETLRLNSNMMYVLVNDTWYDSHADLMPKVGQRFLNGLVEEVLDFETYTATYPEAKEELFPYVTEKTIHRGFIRRVVDGHVKYAVNPVVPNVSNISSEYFVG